MQISINYCCFARRKNVTWENVILGRNEVAVKYHSWQFSACLEAFEKTLFINFNVPMVMRYALMRTVISRLMTIPT